MGLFDSVYIDDGIIISHKIKCNQCDTLLLGKEWQTKCLETCMVDYFLTYCSEAIILQNLLKPHDKKFYHKYTDSELKERKRERKKCKFANILLDGDGYWTADAYRIENRIKEAMPNKYPHQWVNLITGCDICIEKYKNLKEKIDHTRTSMEIDLKFTDGFLKEIKGAGNVKIL